MSTRWLGQLGLLAAALMSAACSEESESIQPDQPGTPAAHRDAGRVDVELPGCPEDLPGPAMVELATPGGARYCIDRTEVTQGQYFAFLDSLSPTGRWRDGFDWDVAEALESPDFCDKNHVLWPQPHIAPCMYEDVEAFDWEGKHPDYPVACVHWCGAYAYCAWAGKRLCGRVGGGSLDPADKANADESQLYNACSQGGKTVYAYGNEYDESACAYPNIPPSYGRDGGATVEPVTSHAETCHGTEPGFSEVLNLSGGPAEWEDSCVMIQHGPLCTVRPAHMLGAQDPAAEAQCASAWVRGPEESVKIGFRCCYDL